MRRLAGILTVVVVLIVFFVILGPFFIVREGEQAVVIRFGEIVDSTREAGLKFKMPVVDQVVKYSNRLLSWDGDPRRMPTAENQFIWVDTTARWRISDPTLFYRSVTTMERAYSRLDDIVESAVRTEISQNDLEEAVRDSNLINEIDRSEAIPTDSAESGEDGQRLQEIASLLTIVENQPDIETGRRRLSENMYDRASDTAKDLGIEILDIVIRQIRYSDDLTESVYDRMVSERRQIAEAYRSYGQGRKQELIGQMENEKRAILSEAYERAETIRGDADAQAAQIYTDAYSRDPEFFAFWRAVESYRRTLPQFRKTLSTDMDYFDFLYSEEGN
jgi:membrane protease subunit HflC